MDDARRAGQWRQHIARRAAAIAIRNSRIRPLWPLAATRRVAVASVPRREAVARNDELLEPRVCLRLVVPFLLRLRQLSLLLLLCVDNVYRILILYSVHTCRTRTGARSLSKCVHKLQTNIHYFSFFLHVNDTSTSLSQLQLQLQLQLQEQYSQSKSLIKR